MLTVRCCDRLSWMALMLSRKRSENNRADQSKLRNHRKAVNPRTDELVDYRISYEHTKTKQILVTLSDNSLISSYRTAARNHTRIQTNIFPAFKSPCQPTMIHFQPP